MKKILLSAFVLISFLSNAQKTENIIIITTDGFRWQEVFKGVDKTIANDKKFNQGDSAYIYKKYFDLDLKKSREKIMPFFWSEIASKGQIYGNRDLGNKVDVANPYWFSYPGYSEIMTGNVDVNVNSNGYKANPNVNVLEKELGLKLQIRMNDFKAIEAAIIKNKAYNEFDQLAQLASKDYPKTMLADYHMAQMYEKKGDNARAVKSYMKAFQMQEIGDLTKEMMINRADELKATLPKKGQKVEEPVIEETPVEEVPTETPTEEKKQE